MDNNKLDCYNCKKKNSLWYHISQMDMEDWGKFLMITSVITGFIAFSIGVILSNNPIMATIIISAVLFFIGMIMNIFFY